MSEQLSHAELLRYHRQISLPHFDIAGQESLKRARVLIVGVGGLGSSAAQMLALSGVGALTLIDDDVVEISNLQRQVLHDESRLGQTKVASAQFALMQLNRELTITTHCERATAELLAKLLPNHDLLLDCSDNRDTRIALNQAAFLNQIPLISAAAIRYEGQLATFRWQEGEPCYQCLAMLFGTQAPRCFESGILAPVVGILGNWQALEALKVLTGVGIPLRGELLLFDALSGSVERLRLPKRSDCPCCGGA